MLNGFKTCEDFEDEGMWDTSLCCAYCHGVYEHDDKHEMWSEYYPQRREGAEHYQRVSIWVCTPLYEQLFLGATHFVKSESSPTQEEGDKVEK